MLTDGDGDLTGSTPRPPATKTIKPQFADLDSPYENLKRQLDQDNTTQTGELRDEDESELLAQHTARLPDMSMTPRSSLDQAARDLQESTARKHKDPLLHRILDKNYRLQATPHKPMSHGVSPIKWKVTEKPKDDKAKAKEKVPLWQESSPMSSPEMEAPKLRSEAFMSPIRSAYRQKVAAVPSGPRTPGISVQTPATGRKTKDIFGLEQGKGNRHKDEITWESDSEEESGDLYGGMSPPKTIQFALPASKLLQTPGRFYTCPGILGIDVAC